MKSLAITAALLTQLSSSVQGQEAAETAHIAVTNPAELSQSEANATYDAIRESMAEIYATSRLPSIKDYQSWKRYNSAPYLSATHGQRFVNSYANDKASAYGRLAKGEKYPFGSVFAKDSLTITDEGKVFPGALYVMEKLSVDAHPDTADWRYIMVLPDGTEYGDTVGVEAEQVKYCHACHAAKADDDFVFFVPEEFRVKE